MKTSPIRDKNKLGLFLQEISQNENRSIQDLIQELGRELATPVDKISAWITNKEQPEAWEIWQISVKYRYPVKKLIF